LSYYVSGQKPRGGATGHAERAGRRLDPKLDDYTKNSSDLQSKFKITVELRIFSHFLKYWLNCFFFFVFFMDLPCA
jgi:hypothetical protein